MSGALDRRRHIRALARSAVAILETEPDTSVPVAAQLVGVSATAVYVAWRGAHPDRPPRGRGVITEAMRAAQRAPFATLCDVLLEHVPRRDGAPAAEIFAAARSDYGTVHERRLWRALQRLVDTGRVERCGPRHSWSTYMRLST